MGKRKLKISLHRISETKNYGWFYTSGCTARKKFHCGTPFLMVRNLSDFNFCCSLSVAYLCAKSGWNNFDSGGGFRLGLLLHGGLF